MDNCNNGRLNIEHAHITCLEYTLNESHPEYQPYADAHGLVMYQDTRTPKEFPTVFLIARWKILPNGHIRTTLSTYKMHTEALQDLHISTNTYLTNDDFVVYHVGPGILPQNTDEAGNMIRAAHIAMRAAQESHTDFIEHLRIALEYTIRTQCPDGIANEHGEDIYAGYFIDGHLYCYAHNAINNDEENTIGTIRLPNLPNIAFPIDRNTMEHIEIDIDEDERVNKHPYIQHKNVPFLHNFCLYPLQDTIIHLDFGERQKNVSHHAHVEDLRREQAIVQKMQPYLDSMIIDIEP